MDQIELSEYGQACTKPSPVARMMGSFAEDFREGVDINLGVGYVNEDTIPRQLIQQAITAIMANPQRYRAPFNYGGPAGSANLIQAIRHFYLDQGIGDLTDQVLGQKRIIIGASGATSLLDAITQVLPVGIVVTADPIYYIYCDQLERAGFQLLTVPEDDQGISTDLLERKLEELGEDRRRISFLYVVTVSNPTCTILSNDRRRRLVEIVVRLSHDLGRKVPLFLDAAYELLVHDPAVERPQSALLHDLLGVVYELGTLSKIIAPALRIGYMIGADGPFIEAIVQKVSDVGFSAPLLSQEIAGYLLEHHGVQQIAEVNRGYREKAQQVKAWMGQYLGEYVEHCRGGSAGFYFYLTFKRIQTHERSPFFRYLSRTTGEAAIDGPPDHKQPRVVYVPGEYCVHPKGDMVQVGRRQLRLSYGFESAPRIQEAFCLMGQAAEYACMRTAGATASS